MDDNCDPQGEAEAAMKLAAAGAERQRLIRLARARAGRIPESGNGKAA
jgi:hypothetical protein